MCGIVGVIGSPNASYEVYRGLLTLQHRGQDASGILSYNQKNHQLWLERGAGYVASVFNREKIQKLKGELAIGHTRYSTVGVTREQDMQPMVLGHPHGLGMVHNGNLVNYSDLQEEIREIHFSWSLTNSDLEVLMSLFARNFGTQLVGLKNDHLSVLKLLKECVQDIFLQAKGGYSVLGTLTDLGLIGFRDPLGIRPLVLGRKKVSAKEKEELGKDIDYKYMLASESVALNYLDYELLRDVEPGELIYINSSGSLYTEQITTEKAKPCMFEWVYFSSPESVVNKNSVYQTRLKLGEALGEKLKQQFSDEDKPEMVVPIPETSRIAAISLSEKLGIPYREVLIKNRYIQRSFILNKQEERENAVRAKLGPVKAELKDKNVLLIDDSIVRGTTSKNIIKLARSAGARKVYFGVTCAPIRFPCYFGIDFPNSEELVAGNKDLETIAKALGADGVIYLETEDIKKSVGLPDLCLACLNGDYPVDIQGAEKSVSNRVKD